MGTLVNLRAATALIGLVAAIVLCLNILLQHLSARSFTGLLPLPGIAG